MTEPCPFHEGYGKFTSEQRRCLYAETRAERDAMERDLAEARAALGDVLRTTNQVQVAETARNALAGMVPLDEVPWPDREASPHD